MPKVTQTRRTRTSAPPPPSATTTMPPASGVRVSDAREHEPAVAELHRRPLGMLDALAALEALDEDIETCVMALYCYGEDTAHIAGTLYRVQMALRSTRHKVRDALRAEGEVST